MEQNHLCNFERRHHGKHSCEVFLNLDQWFRRRCRLKKSLQAADAQRTKTDLSLGSGELKRNVEKYILKKIMKNYPICRVKRDAVRRA